MRRMPQSNALTFWELLLVIVVIAVLVGLLMPTMHGLPPGARDGLVTRRLLSQFAIALEQYKEDWAVYPPDTMPAGTLVLASEPGKAPRRVAEPVLPPEALYYYLTNPSLSAKHPYIQLAKAQRADHDHDGLPEIVDAWGRPILYNRPRFPSGGFDDGSDPHHNRERSDLYSVGRDGQTGSSPLPDPGADLAGFCKKAMDEPADGSGEDDIPNW